MTGKDDNTRMTGKDDNNTHVVGKVWENTRMAGENFDRELPRRQPVEKKHSRGLRSRQAGSADPDEQIHPGS